jgi:hypothetical protein
MARSLTKRPHPYPGRRVPWRPLYGPARAECPPAEPSSERNHDLVGATGFVQS